MTTIPLSEKIDNYDPITQIVVRNDIKQAIQKTLKELKEETSFEGIKWGEHCWKELKAHLIQSFVLCNNEEDFNREFKRIVDNFKIPEIIDTTFKKNFGGLAE